MMGRKFGSLLGSGGI